MATSRTLKQQLGDNRQQVTDLQQENDRASAAITDKESLIEGLARSLVSQSKMVQSSVMGDGYAMVQPSIQPWGDSSHLGFAAFSYSKQHIYDLTATVTEAVYPQDSTEVTLAKMRATFSCVVPNLAPQSATEMTCRLDVPRNGIKFFVKVADKRGPMLTEEYQLGPLLNGMHSSKMVLYGPHGKKLTVSEVTGVEIKAAS